MLDLLQWPAMVITVLAAWLVASRSARKRKAGFWVFLASNLAWVVWGMYSHAYALIVLQVALAALNIRGVHKNEKASEPPASDRGVRAAVPADTSPLPAS
ncbi:MAG TPA: hypothetical protein VIV40_16435 [Kofleriaceae bacterium]